MENGKAYFKFVKNKIVFHGKQLLGIRNFICATKDRFVRRVNGIMVEVFYGIEKSKYVCDVFTMSNFFKHKYSNPQFQ